MDEKSKKEDVKDKDIDQLIKILKVIQGDIKHMRLKIDDINSNVSQIVSLKL